MWFYFFLSTQIFFDGQYIKLFLQGEFVLPECNCK